MIVKQTLEMIAFGPTFEVHQVDRCALHGRLVDQGKEIFWQPGAARSYHTLAEKDILPIHGRMRMQIYHKQVY
jgi:hypothetical protein